MWWAELNPLLLVALALGLGLIALIAQRTGRRPLGRVGMVGAGLAVVWAAAAGFIVTPGEQVIRQTRALLSATAPLQRSAVQALLTSRAALVGPEGDEWIAAGALVDEMDTALARWKVAWHRVNGLQVESVRGDEAAVDLDLRTWLESEYGTMPYATRWRLHWARQADGTWRLRQAQWLELSGDKPLRGMWK